MVSTAFTRVLLDGCCDQAAGEQGLRAIEYERTSSTVRGMKRNDKKEILDLAETGVVISISVSFVISYMQMHCILQDTKKASVLRLAKHEP
jgi:hypothetical protein